MGKAIITITDSDVGEGVSMSYDFEPPLDNTGKTTPLPCQVMAMRIMQASPMLVNGEELSAELEGD